MANSLKSIEQKRAEIAWTFAENRKADGKYAINIPKAPSYIKTNGLLYAVAFMYSKNDWKSNVYDDLETYFKTKDPQSIIKDKFVGNKSLMAVLVSIEDPKLMQQVTVEAMALLSWLKRFVQSSENQ